MPAIKRANKKGKKMSSAITFNLHAVVNTQTKAKARVHYSVGNRIDGRACVTIYAKDYGNELFDVFGDCENNSDMMTDYFEKSRFVVFADSPLYSAALSTAKAIQAKRGF